MSRPRKERYALLKGGFWRNGKVRRLSLEARGLLATAWSYAADQMTDGVVPLELLQAWAGKRAEKLLGELTAGRDEDGHRPLLVIDGIDATAHDWLDVNISRAEWERKLDRDKTSPRKRNGKAIGNATGNQGVFPTGNPIGNVSDIQADALDEDEDEDQEEDEDLRSRSLARSRGSVARARESAPVSARERAPEGSAGLAQLAYDRALRAGNRGAYVDRDGDASAFRTVADAAERCRGGRSLAEQLDAWADDFVRERRRLGRISWWAEWAQERAATGSAQTGAGYSPESTNHAREGVDELEDGLTDADLERADRGRRAHA